MKLLSRLVFLSLLLFSTPAHALSWAYPFVVWDGKVYEVKQENVIPKEEVGKRIGEVKTIPNDMTGRYYGDASNMYPKGTAYHAIEGKNRDKTIAVKDDGRYVEAVYRYDSPFHVLDILTNPLFQIVMLVLISLPIAFFIRNAIRRRRS
ncbi:hypothetical protein [Exiguobacterium flavidum]|uniref:hypothetical protein n=1 Tax=Exiguobacterium flavidum TaxID=2184695 RepID=UPI000DF75EB9|nr:hypothetical protein [Exiguobacterium flavidum]